MKLAEKLSQKIFRRERHRVYFVVYTIHILLTIKIKKSIIDLQEKEIIPPSILHKQGEKRGEGCLARCR
jgi:hypothetical protein